ncbi:serine hydrolase domain-containing protein [Streptomyces johnsoniae]|uniref:Serine hydrolase domain-containing protein n=1 Tax=Streptomyces johnsoniae TaxID=3075532 RepID=A0ABU2S902_9ACTN|nr:serine hydrolase domain-containing protein [Streptomyces sp. DSM 41886]MDT0445293.1 serine hydrolase domain-containing protein [Streptomyces sp. DSM 41886]
MTTSRGPLRTALALTLATGLSGLLIGCAEAEASPDPAPDKRLAELAQTAADTGSLGVIVRVEQGDGRLVELARQAEWTKDDHDLAATDQFRVGSNTKSVTATLILQLVAEHRLGLDDPVERWLPGLVPGGQDITVEMLLNHTSGLDDYLLTPDFLPSLTGQEQRVWQPGELLAITQPQDPPTAPGESHYYSNANYTALGLILERATGQSLSELIAERITDPLGMNDSFLATSGSWDPEKPHASGYEPDAERLRDILAPVVDLPEGIGFVGPERPHDNVNTTDIDPSWSWAAGGMVSTAEDWTRFLSALMSGELLPEAQMEQMRTTVPIPDEDGDYGLGLMRKTTSCGTVWGHTGGLPGYSSEIYTDDTGQRSVAVLTNTNFGIMEAEAAAANSALIDAAICDMLDEPFSATGNSASSS